MMSEACTIRLTGRANSRCGAGDRKGTRAETTGRWHRRERESALQGSRGVRSRTAGASRTPGRARRPAQRRGAVEERRGRTSATYCGPSASVKGIQGEVWEVNQRKVRGGAALALTNALRYHAARTNQRRGDAKGDGRFQRMSTSCRGAACYVSQEIGTGQYAVDTPDLAGGRIKPRERTSGASVRELGVRERPVRSRSGSTYRLRVIGGRNR